MSACTPPSDLLLRFGQFVGQLRQTIVTRLERGGSREGLGPLGLVLWSYLGRTLRRLAALHGDFIAGTVKPARSRAASPRPPAARKPAATASPARAVLPRGPVLLRFHAAHLATALAALIDDPQMQALLAATPRAGRLLRPLWRRLTPDRLPPALRLPARTRPPRPSRSPAGRQSRLRPPASKSETAGRKSAPKKTGRDRTSRWHPHWAPHGPTPTPRSAPRPPPLLSG